MFLEYYIDKSNGISEWKQLLESHLIELHAEADEAITVSLVSRHPKRDSISFTIALCARCINSPHRSTFPLAANT